MSQQVMQMSMCVQAVSHAMHSCRPKQYHNACLVKSLFLFWFCQLSLLVLLTVPNQGAEVHKMTGIYAFHLQLQEIPLMYQLLVSGNQQHSEEQMWVMQLLAAGLRGPLDAQLYRSAHLYSYYSIVASTLCMLSCICQSSCVPSVVLLHLFPACSLCS